MSKALMRRAVREFGSQDKLAAAIGFSQTAVRIALVNGHVSPLMAYRIHVATAGRFKYVDLCPLLDPARQLELARKHVNGVPK